MVDAQLQLARQQKQQSSSSSTPAQSEKEDTAKQKITDALIIAWAYNSRRFYVFSHIDPVADEKDDDNGQALIRRDHWNEQPDAQDAAAALNAETAGGGSAQNRLATAAVLHTTMGDIHVQLFGQQTPKTVENFGTHARNGYYDGLLFHRVIKGFMLQTGDPNGDGTGGEVRGLFVLVRFCWRSLVVQYLDHSHCFGLSHVLCLCVLVYPTEHLGWRV